MVRGAGGRALVIPDGIGRMSGGGREISFFLEYDRGTEHHDQLERKIDRYRILPASYGRRDVLLFMGGRAPRLRRSRPAGGRRPARRLLDSVRRRRARRRVDRGHVPRSCRPILASTVPTRIIRTTDG